MKMYSLLYRNRKYIVYFIIALISFHYLRSSNNQTSSNLTGYIPEVKIIDFDQNDDLFLFLHIQKTGGYNIFFIY